MKRKWIIFDILVLISLLLVLVFGCREENPKPNPEPKFSIDFRIIVEGNSSVNFDSSGVLIRYELKKGDDLIRNFEQVDQGFRLEVKSNREYKISIKVSVIEMNGEEIGLAFFSNDEAEENLFYALDFSGLLK